MNNLVKTGLLTSLTLLVYCMSLAVDAAEAAVDLSKAKQMCANASPQQRQMAKAAGYDLDSLCAQLNASGSKLTEDSTAEKVTQLPERRTRAEAKQSMTSTERANPLAFFTPEQIAAMTPDQLAKVLEELEEEPVIEEEELKPFGYELFAGEPESFQPNLNVPIPANYVIGPGDLFEVQLFGKSSQNLSLQVDRNGQVAFPDLGPITVAGLNFDEARQLLKSRVKQQMIGIEASITLGELRSIQVFVLGEAYRPGAYTISSVSTMTNALFVSGGISDIGSLRNIQLKRQGKLMASLDLYDLLLRGDTSDDARLLPGDVIYVPPVGDTVAVDGAVKRPAIYELRNESTVKEVINIAGGLAPTAFKNEAQIKRIDDSGFMTSLQVNQPQQSNVKVKAGDHLRVQQRVEVARGVVKLTGHVLRPKQMAWQPNMRVSDLVYSLDALKALPQLKSALLIREILPLRTLEVEVVQLDRALQMKGSAFDKILNPQDELLVLGFSEEREELLTPLIEKLEQQASAGNSAKVVSISGLVRFPGKYPLAKDMDAHQLIELAGGLAESAYSLNSEVTRISLTDPEHTQVEHHFIDLVASDNQFKLQSRDVLNVRQRPEYREFATIEVKGEVKFPGIYRIKKGETLRDLMKRVGGFTDFAHVEATLFTRAELKEREEKQLQQLRQKLKSDIANSQLEQSNVGKSTNLNSLEQLSENLDTTEALGRLVIDMQSVLSGKSEDVILKDGDSLIVPAFRQEVSVVGEVQYPTSHLFDPYLTFEEYIERSGGETEKADDERIYIVKADGSVVLPYRSGWVNAIGVEIQPGDTIVVPLDVNATNDLALWSQVSQIIYQLALGAAAITRL
ncbi:MAG: SLBB domain-containing protein [Oceanospirillaceae bacterium]|nr:SLBB domain-containing protein [Oceanospirillaceae bacterium]